MSVLWSVFKDLLGKGRRAGEEVAVMDDPAESPRLRFLNVGGNSKSIEVPAHFANWEHVLLDIDATGNPDVVCDARDLTQLDPEEYDAVYCSHNLELHDAVYECEAGPITYRDVIWGFGKQIEQSGVDFYAHKTGFFQRSLDDILIQAGFEYVAVMPAIAILELHVAAFKQMPFDTQLNLLGLPSSDRVQKIASA